MPELGNQITQSTLSEGQLSQLQKAFENKPADVIRGQFAESEPILEAATKKKPSYGKKKPKTKPKAKPKARPKAQAKSQVV